MVLRMQPELERNSKVWATCGIVALALLLTLVWLVLLSRIRWRTRLIAVAALAVVIFGATKVLRVDGTLSGIGLPRLAFKWASVRNVPLTAPSTPESKGNTAPRSEDMGEATQFFGSHRDGMVVGAKLSRDWNTTPPKQLWRQPIGAGWSAFAVVGGRAYTQEQRGEDEAVTCYDAITGRLIWIHTDKARFFQWQGGEGPRATPTVFAGKVFTNGGTGILNCLDSATGQIVWSRDVLKENHLENLTWGVSASPLVFDDKVVVTGGGAAGPTLLAYNNATGAPMWSAGTDKASYASPILTTLAGRRVVLSVNAGSLTAHDPASGEVLLDYPWAPEAKWPKAAQPVVLEGDRVFLSAGYGAGCVLLQVKADAAGKLAGAQLWKSMRMKTQFNSVGARDGCLFGLDDGMLACLDVATGNRRWKTGRFGSGQTLLVNDMILVQSEPGAFFLGGVKPDGYEELGQIPALSSKTWNYPTLAGRYLLLRNDQEAVCYELPVEDAQRN